MRSASFISKTGPLLLCLGLAAAAARLWRGQKRAMPRSTVPSGPEAIAAAARARGLTIPPACEPGVAANLALLASHAERLRGTDPAAHA